MRASSTALRSASTPACATAKPAAQGQHDLDHRNDPLTHEPPRVWRFFTDEVEMLYPDWHPEHMSWRWWLRRQPLAQGTSGTRTSGWGVGGSLADSKSGKPSRNDSSPTPSAPVLTRASRRLVPPRASANRRLRANPRRAPRFRHPGPSPLDPIIALVVPLRELLRHMREEQANLTTLLAATP
jgi:hypothetical protein